MVLSVNALAKESFLFELNIKGQTVYAQTSETEYAGQQVTTQTSFKMAGESASGEKAEFNMGPETSVAPATENIRLEGTTLTSFDTSTGLSTSMQVKRTFRGFKVSAAELTKAMSAAMKQKSQDLVTAFNFSTGEGEISFALNTDGMVCVHKGSNLVCDFDFNIRLSGAAH